MSRRAYEPFNAQRDTFPWALFLLFMALAVEWGSR